LLLTDNVNKKYNVLPKYLIKLGFIEEVAPSLAELKGPFGCSFDAGA